MSWDVADQNGGYTLYGAQVRTPWNHLSMSAARPEKSVKPSAVGQPISWNSFVAKRFDSFCWPKKPKQKPPPATAPFLAEL